MLSRAMFALTLASIAVLVLGIWQVLDKPVRGFVIEGELSALEREQLEQTLAAEDVGGVLSTDLSGVLARLKQLPWARDVSVQRRWPDQLAVTLHRARPVARWGTREYVSAFGDLLSLPDEYVGLPHFEVAVSTPLQAMKVYQLLDQIAARAGLVISTLAQNQQGEWRLQLDDGPDVLLGGEDLNERMHRVLMVHRRVLADTDKTAEYIDARYANGVAVRFADELDTTEQAMLAARHDAPFEGNE